MYKTIRFVSLIFFILIAVACSKVSQSNYEQVKQGMSMSQVVHILGEPTHSESINIAGIGGTSATWKEKDAQIDIQFLNDQVTIKAYSKAGRSRTSENVKEKPSTF